MQTNEEILRQKIALGWIASLLLLATTLEAMMLQGLFTEADFFALRTDPGYEGLVLLKVFSAVYVLMAMGVYVFESRRFFRWIAVVVSIFLFFMLLLHHLSHWYFGQRPTLGSHVMDVMHHLSMGWVVWNSIRWARVPRTTN